MSCLRAYSRTKTSTIEATDRCSRSAARRNSSFMAGEVLIDKVSPLRRGIKPPDGYGKCNAQRFAKAIQLVEYGRLTNQVVNRPMAISVSEWSFSGRKILKISRSSCSGALMTLSEIVAAYIRERRDSARAEMRFFEIQRNLTQAIRKAALCVLPSGKRHPHQRRIPRMLLELVEARLQEVQAHLRRAENFDELHRVIAERIGSISGIGSLTVYDITHRIGAYIGKHPKLVYLHAGTRKGAMTFNIRGDYFDPRILPKPFSRLQPYEIEDCLCIYKDNFGADGSSRPIPTCLAENPKWASRGCERILQGSNKRQIT